MKKIFFLLCILCVVFTLPLSAEHNFLVKGQVINGEHKNTDYEGNDYYYRNNSDIGNPSNGGYGQFGTFYKNGHLWEYDFNNKHIKETINFIVLDEKYNSLPKKSILFCIEPLNLAEWIDGDNLSDNEFSKLDKEVQDNVSKISSLAISKFSSTGDYDYLAAGQLLIWEEVGAKNIKYDKSLNKEIDDIRLDFKTYETIPSFLESDKKIELTYNEEKKIYDVYLKDKNEVLDRKYIKGLLGEKEGFHIEDGSEKNDIYIWTNDILELDNISSIYDPTPKEADYLLNVYYPIVPSFINSGQDLVSGLSFKNEINLNLKVKEALGKVSLEKLGCFEKECKKLSGVEFGLYNEEDELIKKAKTNENAFLEFNNLKIGSYYIKELKTNSDYILSDKKYDFSIVKDNDDVLLNEGNPVINKKKVGDIIIHKKDFEERVLKGAEFVYYKDLNSNKKLDVNELSSKSKVYISNEKGEVGLIDLAYGDYLIKETKAPNNYQKYDLLYPISLHSNRINLNVYNTKIKELVKTGKRFFIF